MKKFKAILSITVIAILCFSLVACGNSNEESAADGYHMPDMNYEETGAGFSVTNDVNKGKSGEAEQPAAPQQQESKKTFKLIYRADIYLQTLDFDESLEAIEKIVEEKKGYFESRQINNGTYYTDSDGKTGSFTIRVPFEKYKDFLDMVSGACHVVSLSQNIEDIGAAYFDTENRIKTLEIKEERLQKLLSAATKMSDIIELESALSDNEYALESLKSQLRDYDSLVDYSTITLSLESVETLSENVNVKLNFGQRLWLSVKNGANDFVRGFENIAVWFSYNLLQLAVLIIVVLLVLKLKLISRGAKLIKTKVFHKNISNDDSKVDQKEN